MKALVLAGGVPQAVLLQKLKERHIITVLADCLPNPLARPYADRFYQESTLDIESIRKIAVCEQVNFLITACTDQALLTVAILSEELNLPCYISAKTARNVTDKRAMKALFKKNNIPTSDYMIVHSQNEIPAISLQYPLVVKPVDCNSSKGVRKVLCEKKLNKTIQDSMLLSRSRCAIVEEFVEGRELSVDAWVTDGIVTILSIIEIKKVGNGNGFVIHRTLYPAQVCGTLLKKITVTAEKIASSFSLYNSPMLIQLIASADDISIVEFSARSGGGMKFSHIKTVSNFDVIDAVIDLTLGFSPSVEEYTYNKYRITEYLYCHIGQYDHYEGIDSLIKDNTIDDFYVYKNPGDTVGGLSGSNDRVAGFTVSGDSYQEAADKYQTVARSIRICDTTGKSLLCSGLLHLDSGPVCKSFDTEEKQKKEN